MAVFATIFTPQGDGNATIEDYAFAPLDDGDSKSFEIGGFASSAFNFDVYQCVGIGFFCGDGDWVGHDWVGHDSVINKSSNSLLKVRIKR